VLQTDFGRSDGAVSAMYGVALTVDPSLKIFDITHDIPPYNIWEASYRLYQTITYWPEGTVFISVVDPGVGTSRRSVVVKTVDHQYIVTPDNGTLTHIKNDIGIKEARVIDETCHRLHNPNGLTRFMDGIFLPTRDHDSRLVLFHTRKSVRKRSEEHTSELQSRFDLVCRLLLEKKK